MMTPQEERILNAARQKIEEQQELLRRLTAPAYHLGIVCGVYPKTVVVDTGSQLFELDRIEGGPDIKVGQGVDIHPQTGQIAKVSDFVSYGSTGTVSQIDGNIIQISVPSGLITTEYSLIPVSIGDKIVMNSTNHVIMKKLPTASKYAFKTSAVLDWKDIGACEDAKKELIAALETPYTASPLFKFFNKDQIKGALLWGRPGNGKTLLGRAAAGALARMHGVEARDSGFIYIKGPEILDKYVGETESQIREAFAYAKAHFKKHGCPAVMFVDEADAVMMRRGSRTASGMEMTIVPQFLSEMDGIEDSGVFVLLATNRADTLDPAIIRPGRCDRRVHVAPPNKLNAPEIWDIHMRKVPVTNGVSKEQLIQSVNDTLFSEQFPLYLIDTPNGRKTFSLGNLVSGAMIAGAVERASAIGIDRNLMALCGTTQPTQDQLAKVDPKKFDGLSQGDFTAALAAMHKEQYGMNHFDELREFIDMQKLEVTSIEQCHDGQKIERPKPQPRKEPEIIGVIPMPTGKKFDA
jgi:proteasome-associated ATPase